MKTTWLVPLAAALSLLLIVSGCSNDDDSSSSGDPRVVLSEGEVTSNSIGFTIASSDATNVAYVVLKADEQIPDVSGILAEGTRVEANGQVAVTVDGLESKVEYVVAAAAGNDGAQMSEPALLRMTTKSDLFANITSEYTNVWWYGPIADSGCDQFCLQLSSAEVDGTLMPVEGGDLIRFYLYTEPVLDDMNVILAPGTYEMGTSGGYAPFTYDPDASIYARGSNADNFMQINFESGTVTVAYADGQYTITADVVIADGEGSKVKASYSGALTIIDYSDGIRHFATDQNEVMTGMTGAITPSSMVPDLDDYTITLYNCPLDKDGFIIGAGFVSNCELYAKAVPYEVYDFSGTYTANSQWDQSIYKAGTYITGFIYDMYGMKVPAGTYLSEYDDAGNMIGVGLAQDGEIVVTRGDGKCKIDMTLTTNKGITLVLSYDGPDVPLLNRKGTSSDMPFMTRVSSRGLSEEGSWTSLRPMPGSRRIAVR